MSRNKDKYNSSNFELLSDLSLSTLGLFLIVFVIYSIVFDSSSVGLLNKINELNSKISELQVKSNDLDDKILRLKSEIFDLSLKNNNLLSQNRSLNNDLNNANQRADNAEREKQQEIKRNQYTGYYTGYSQAKLYKSNNYNICEGEYEIINQKLSLTYIQNNNILIYSIQSSEGTITFNIQGSLQGNTFIGVLGNYQRNENGYMPCDSSTDKFYIDFFPDRAEIYNGSVYDNRITLTKQ